MFSPRVDLYIQAFPGRLVVEVADGSEKREVIHGAGFDHPRLPVGDFTAAERSLKEAIKRLMPSNRHRVGSVLFHVQHAWEGGLTQVDIRAISDLVISAASGLRRANVYTIPRDVPPAEVQRLLCLTTRTEPGLLV